MNSDVVTRRIFTRSIMALAVMVIILKATGYADDGIELELASPGVFLVLGERKAMIVSVPVTGAHAIAEGTYVHATPSIETNYYEVDIPECGTYKLAGSSTVVDCGNCDSGPKSWSCELDPVSLAGGGWQVIQSTSPRLSVQGKHIIW